MSCCKPSNSSKFLLFTIAVAVAVGIGAGLRQTPVQGQDAALVQAKTSIAASHTNLQPSGKTPADLKNDPTVNQANSLSKAFRDAAQVAMPSVVTIKSHTNAKKVSARGNRQFQFRGNGQNPFKGTPFEDLLPQLPDGYDGGQGFSTPPQDGVGSGVIIDSTGIVLTNNHVVQGADTVIVHLADGREFKATDIKTDPRSDLAVVRIQSDKSLPAAYLGDSDQLSIGDWVIAIGNPFDLEQTVSAGIISGKGRELRSAQRTKFLQTDAAINPGNSGGPLVNLVGEVVGINTAIASNNGYYQGVGFAIPINHAKWVTEQLIHHGSVSRGYLGVKIGQLTDELAQQFGVAKGRGVVVAEVFPDTPAAAAKMRDGDVIVKFAGQEVRSPREVQELVERAPMNEAQPVEVMRDGKAVTLNVVVKSLPDEFGNELNPRQQLENQDSSPSSGYENKDLGLEVGELAAEESKAFAGYDGVVIRNVDRTGIAAEAGLRPGMLICKVGRTPVKNVKEFEEAMKQASLKDGVMFQIRTELGNNFVVLKAE
ncbi:MAG: Do family serine endopeptidase [Pirellulales bacterium]|nr:Do family serine endopeptidase [Pirellulales bacterium]